MKDISNALRSEVLIDALPYIQKYHNKIVVVKYGGNAMTNEELKDCVMSDIVLLNAVGIKVVLVHGGGPEINAMLNRVGIESKFIGGLRYTDEETIEIVKMVLAGKVNKELVSHLQMHGGKALGLCGTDGEMIIAEKKQGEIFCGCGHPFLMQHRTAAASVAHMRAWIDKNFCVSVHGVCHFHIPCQGGFRRGLQFVRLTSCRLHDILIMREDWSFHPFLQELQI